MPLATTMALVVAAPTLFRQGLVTLFRERWPQLLLTLTADTTQVAELITHRSFRLVVLDGGLPGQALPELLLRVHRVRPTQRLLLLADQRPLAEPPSPLAWPGTRLRLSRHVSPLTLAAALEPWLNAPGTALTPGCAAPPERDFSPRELEVLRLVVDDCCNEEIADRLFLSVRTVESHRRTLLHKAGTRTLVGLAARAVREGWVA